MYSIFPWFKIVRYRRVRRKAGKRSREEYKKHHTQAREIALQKLAHWNQFYNFSYSKVFIRAQKTRWGSCSSKGNLNFNYRLVFLPVELQDYLIVHELCHLGEMNHSSRFWALVEKTIPDYRKLRKRLRMGYSL